MASTPEKSFGHFKIISAIGRGGMGEVFLAQDTKLDRKVALKILPQEFAEDADRMSRFVREAKSASALNHPNIITIHEIGETEGTHFIATEFIDGKTLNEYAKRNPLNFKSALEIAIQITSALDEAHSAGIVHRDIKPDNVMVRSNGLVKILDFGIAKLSAVVESNEEAATAIKGGTTPGMIIGTANYMSPEQAKGKEVDARSDIFSFGIVLYEMLAGKLPFDGETALEMIGAILHKEPKSLNSEVPIEIEKIIGKCLQKNRGERYQTIKDVCDELRELKQELDFQDKLERTAAPNRKEQKTQILQASTTAEEITSKDVTLNKNSIAVLPFTNMSADEENEYFCDGLAEELLNALAKIDDLKVAARTSAFSFKGKNTNVSEIGQKLSVKTVLEGSVRKSGNRLRISVQLVNAADGYHLWSERYDRELRDIFDVQDEIALAVVDALKLKLFGDEKAAVLKRYTDDAEVHELYLKGRYHLQKHTPDGWQKAVEYFQQATRKDTEYALGYAGLSSVLIFQWFFGFVPSDEVIPKAKEAASRALEIDGGLDEAHLAIAQISMFYEWNFAKAEREYQAAIRLNPGNAFAHHQYGLCLTVMEKTEQAIFEGEKAIEREPLSIMATFQAAAIYLWNDRNEDCLRCAERLIEMAPNFFGGYFWQGVALIKKGRFENAISMLEKASTLDDRQGIVKSFLGQANALAGKQSKARESIKELQDDFENNKASAFHIAAIYGSLRDAGKTFEWLEKAYQDRDGVLIYLKLLSNWREGEIWGREFRSDKRLQGLLQRIGLSPNKTNQTDESLEAKTGMLKPTTADGKQTEGETQIFKVETGETSQKIIAEKSVAVLPFADMSADADNEYFCDGLAEELLNALTKIEDLKVAARTSAFAFKGKNTNADEIGNILNVRTILEGSVRKSGNRIRITVQLINASDGYHLWSERYDREMQDIFDVQDEITLAVIDALKLKLFGDEKAEILKRGTENAEAYQLYLKGRYHYAKRMKDDILKGIDYFQQAIKLDSNFALAQTGIADSYNSMAKGLHLSAKESVPQAKAAAKRALEIDPSLAEAHAALADCLAIFDWNWAESEREFKRAVELNPNVSHIHLTYGVSYLVPMGRLDEAITKVKRAVELEPLSFSYNSILAEVFLYARQNDKALEQAQNTYDLDPNFGPGRYWLSEAYLANGMYDEAIALGAKVSESYPTSVRALAYVKSGRKREAEQIIERLRERAKTEYVPSYHFATIYAALGDKEKAFAELEKSFEQRNWFLPRLKIDPKFDPLRDDPRFQDLVRRIGLPQ